jgi:hypothetical protein
VPGSGVRDGVAQRLPEDEVHLFDRLRADPGLVSVDLDERGQVGARRRVEEQLERLLQALDGLDPAQFTDRQADGVEGRDESAPGRDHPGHRPVGVGMPVDLEQFEVALGDADAVADPVVQVATDAPPFVGLRLAHPAEQHADVRVGGHQPAAGQHPVQRRGGQGDLRGAAFAAQPPGKAADRATEQQVGGAQRLPRMHLRDRAGGADLPREAMAGLEAVLATDLLRGFGKNPAGLRQDLYAGRVLVEEWTVDGPQGRLEFVKNARCGGSECIRHIGPEWCRWAVVTGRRLVISAG